MSGGKKSDPQPDDMKGKVRDWYGSRARTMSGSCGPSSSAAPSCGCCGPSGDTAPSAGCCGPASAAGSSCCSPGAGAERGRFGGTLYDPESVTGLPPEAVAASLGCGNPAAAADLAPGEVVLDLGSGAGLDVLLSARRVGPIGKAYGLDMTGEMLALARENQRRAGIENVEFLEGDIEDIPLPDEAVDVVISNCAINLARDKDRVFREVFRVLRPGGRLAVTDTLFEGDTSLVPAAIRESAEAWAACVAGALEVDDYRRRLEEAGFTGVSIEVFAGHNLDLPPGVRFVSGVIRATKPGP